MKRKVSCLVALVAVLMSVRMQGIERVKQVRPLKDGYIGIVQVMPPAATGQVIEQAMVDSTQRLTAVVKLRFVEDRAAITVVEATKVSYLGFAQESNPAQTLAVTKALGLHPSIPPFQRLPIKFPTPELGGQIAWFSDLQYAFYTGAYQSSSACNMATLDVATATSIYIGATAAAAAAQAAANAAGNPAAAIGAWAAAVSAYANLVRAREAQTEACGQP